VQSSAARGSVEEIARIVAVPRPEKRRKTEAHERQKRR
jgi:hypothetical protein